jgi:hypothetical protein
MLETLIVGGLSANRKLSKRQPLHAGLPSLGSDRNFLRRIELILTGKCSCERNPFKWGYSF